MKIKSKLNNQLINLTKEVSVGVMALATVVGSLELSNHPSNRYILPTQPLKIAVGDENELNNPMRRESEESSQNYISYSESQRTPSRSGRF